MMKEESCKVCGKNRSQVALSSCLQTDCIRLLPRCTAASTSTTNSKDDSGKMGCGNLPHQEISTPISKKPFPLVSHTWMMEIFPSRFQRNPFPLVSQTWMDLTVMFNESYRSNQEQKNDQENCPVFRNRTGMEDHKKRAKVS
jgi:hypothetical protein